MIWPDSPGFNSALQIWEAKPEAEARVCFSSPGGTRPIPRLTWRAGNRPLVVGVLGPLLSGPKLATLSGQGCVFGSSTAVTVVGLTH